MTSAATETDVVVIGAGLAGLRCAVDLAAAGLDVVVLERDEVAGGRVRTDETDGFLVDRGFQLLNPAYSALTDLDVGSLALQPFGAGVAARHEGGLQRLGHPRAARLLPATIAYLARDPGEARALARWARPLLRRPGSSLPVRLQDLVESGRLGPTLAQSWDRAGLDGRTRRIIERFLTGVLLDEDGASPADLALLLIAAFLRGTPGLPVGGMRALPALLADQVPDLRLSTPVAGLGGGGAHRQVHTDAGAWVGRAVVVATDAVAAGDLLGQAPTPMRGVVTAWFAAADDLPRSDLLHVDVRARPAGPLANAAVVTDAAPSYGRRPVPGTTGGATRLVQASAVLTARARPPAVDEMRGHAADLLGGDPRRWDVVTVHKVTRALPDPGKKLVRRRPVRLEAGLYVCGDHRDTPSIQGALVSGRRTARAVRDDLGRG